MKIGLDIKLARNRQKLRFGPRGPSRIDCNVKMIETVYKPNILSWYVLTLIHGFEFLTQRYNVPLDTVSKQMTPSQQTITNPLFIEQLAGHACQTSPHTPSCFSPWQPGREIGKKPVIYYCLFCQTKYLPSIPQQLTITGRSSRVHLCNPSSGTPALWLTLWLRTRWTPRFG